MKKPKISVKKIIMIILVLLLVPPILLAIGLRINHLQNLKTEAEKYPPIGEIVEANKTKMHVYSQGQGDQTIVFLPGHGTTSPTIDFKPLWSQLTDEYKIIVVERPGYGWSDTSRQPRDIETMLNETRQALELTGNEPPYIIAPHSMSGLEAIYWAQTYPEEVEAIIGLDPTIPEYVQEGMLEQSTMELNSMYLISRLGLSRFMPEEQLTEIFPILETDLLSEKDKEQFVAMFYKSAFTTNMLREARNLQSNAAKILENEKPKETPIYLFIAKESQDTYPEWVDYLMTYAEEFTTAEYKLLDAGHYIHHDQPEIIAEEIKKFLSN